jgi:hypothetical protein
MTHHRAHEATAETGEPIPEMITPVGGKRQSDGTLQPITVLDDGSLVTSGTVTFTGTVSTKTPLTVAAPTQATVGVASSEVVPANASRKGLEIVLLTKSVQVSFGFGAPAVLNNGVTLTQYGSSFSLNEYDFNLSAVNAIASVAGVIIGIQEYS